MKKKSSVIVAILFLLVTVVACEKILPPAPADEDVLAGTIPGLTAQQEKEHLIGDAAFGKIFTAAEGLGPIFV